MGGNLLKPIGFTRLAIRACHSLLVHALVAHFGHAGKSSANRGKDRGCRPPSCATKARSREN